MRRVALTGGIATGKSYVLVRFRELGVPVVDADRLARDVVRRGGPALPRIVDRFGARVLTADGELDRARMAAIVFEDATARRDLERIIHPEVYARMHDWFTAEAARSPGAYAVADIPLLYETGRDRDFDRVIVTACAPATQIRRLQARDGLTEAEARTRLAAQWPIEEKRRRADFVIVTDGTRAETDRQTADIHRRLLEEADGRRS